MATHSSILAKGNPWTEKPGGLQSMGQKESDTTEQLNNNGFGRGCKPYLLLEIQDAFTYL